jgi:hypothetical protein
MAKPKAAQNKAATVAENKAAAAKKQQEAKKVCEPSNLHQVGLDQPVETSSSCVLQAAAAKKQESSDEESDESSDEEEEQPKGKVAAAKVCLCFCAPGLSY